MAVNYVGRAKFILWLGSLGVFLQATARPVANRTKTIVANRTKIKFGIPKANRSKAMNFTVKARKPQTFYFCPNGTCHRTKPRMIGGLAIPDHECYHATDPDHPVSTKARAWNTRGSVIQRNNFTMHGWSTKKCDDFKARTACMKGNGPKQIAACEVASTMLLPIMLRSKVSKVKVSDLRADLAAFLALPTSFEQFSNRIAADTGKIYAALGIDGTLFANELIAEIKQDDHGNVEKSAHTTAPKLTETIIFAVLGKPGWETRLRSSVTTRAGNADRSKPAQSKPAPSRPAPSAVAAAAPKSPTTAPPAKKAVGWLSSWLR